MESLLHALSAIKTCIEAHGTEYQKDAFDYILKDIEDTDVETNKKVEN